MKTTKTHMSLHAGAQAESAFSTKILHMCYDAHIKAMGFNELTFRAIRIQGT
jgi:hypothetical protein